MPPLYWSELVHIEGRQSTCVRTCGSGVSETAVKGHTCSYVPRSSGRLSYFKLNSKESCHVKIGTRLFNMQRWCDAHCSDINWRSINQTLLKLVEAVSSASTPWNIVSTTWKQTLVDDCGNNLDAGRAAVSNMPCWCLSVNVCILKLQHI